MELPNGRIASERGPEGPNRHHLPESEQAPCLSKGDVWENQVRRKRNRQNLFVIQMIGPRRLRVKRKTRTCRISSNALIQNGLRGGFILEILWKNSLMAPRALGLWFLRWRNPRSYLPSR